MAKDFEHISNPYDAFLQRGEPDAGNGSVETMPVRSDGSMGDVWINNFLKSSNWNPRSVGFYIDGQTGYAEFTNIYASGTITATSGTIGGWTISASELSSGSVKLQSTAERILLGLATAPLTGVGIFIGLDGADYELRVGDPASAYMHWDGTNLNVVGSAITTSSIASIPNSTATDISLLGWTHDITFSATDLDTVAWTTGTITLSTGRTFAIAPAADTGNMAARTYIYLDTAVSSTALQTTTTAATAIGANKILIAVAVNSTDKAEFQVFGGTGNKNVLVDNIAANSASTNEFVSNTAQIRDLIVTNAKINDLGVSKLTAGTITSKAITLAISAGVGDTYIAAGKTDFDNTVAGFILGLDDSDSDRAKFYIGDSSIYLNWTGTALDVVGGIITSGTIQSASSGSRFVMTNAVQRYEALNANGDIVATMNWSSVTSTDAVLKLAPTYNARRALEIIIPSAFAGGGSEADAKAIIIDNAADSISIDITDGGIIGLSIAGCTQESILITSVSTTDSAIDVTHTGDNNPALNITATGSDDSGIEISCTPVNTSTAGIVVTLGSTSTGSGIRIIDPATSVVSTSVGIFIDRDANSASDAYGMSVDTVNAGAGAAIGINLAFASMHAFAVNADATAEGSYAGRFPIRVAGATRYVSYHNA